MTEEKKAPRRRRKTTTKKETAKVVDSAVTLPDNVVLANDRTEANTEPPAEIAPAEDIKVIEQGPAKVIAHKDRFMRIIAIEDCVGRNGGIRIDIKAGQSYTFPTAVAKWLISIGRAK